MRTHHLGRLAGLLPALGVTAVVLVAAAAEGQWSADSQAAVPRIELAAFKAAVDSRVVLAIDVRDPDAYAAGHIPGALSVPLDRLDREAPKLRAAKQPIVAYCA